MVAVEMHCWSQLLVSLHSLCSFGKTSKVKLFSGIKLVGGWVGGEHTHVI